MHNGLKPSLVIVLLDAGFAGHTRTALAIARELKKREWDITFIISERNRSHCIEGFHIEYVAYNRFWGFLPGLYRLVRSLKPELTHIFEKCGSAELRIISQILNIQTVSTICGITYYKESIVHDQNIFLSKEFYDQFVTLHKNKRIGGTIIPNRIDLTKPVYSLSDDKKELIELLIRKKEEGFYIVLRIAQLHDGKYRSIMAPAMAVDSLHSKGKKILFIHVGEYKNDEHREEFLSYFGNKKHLISMNDFVDFPIPLIEVADVVVGTGRSCFEAMLYDKPVLIVGKNNSLGFLTDNEENRLIETNFSGRSKTELESMEETAQSIVGSLSQIIDDGSFSTFLTREQKRVLNDNYNVEVGVDKYERVYESILKQNKKSLYPFFASIHRYIVTRFIALIKEKDR